MCYNAKFVSFSCFFRYRYVRELACVCGVCVCVCEMIGGDETGCNEVRESETEGSLSISWRKEMVYWRHCTLPSNMYWRLYCIEGSFRGRESFVEKDLAHVAFPMCAMCKDGTCQL